MAFTFRGKKLSLPASDDRQWHNLETGRKIKNSQGHLYFLPEPLVAGTLPSIVEFLQENGLQYDTGKLIAGLLPAKPKVVAAGSLPEPLSPPLTLTGCVGGVSFGFSTCELDKAISRVKDVKVKKQIKGVTSLFEDLRVDVPAKVPKVPPPLETRELNEVFKGLRVTGKCVYIVDGDTLDVEVMIPLSHFNPLVRGTFPMRLRTRLLEYDAAEKETQHGLVAGILFASRLMQDNFFITLEIEKIDLHSRALAFGYTLSGERYSEYMLSANTPLGKIALSYTGGTKSTYFTKMHERTQAEADFVKNMYQSLITDKLREILNPEIASWL